MNKSRNKSYIYSIQKTQFGYQCVYRLESIILEMQYSLIGMFYSFKQSQHRKSFMQHNFTINSQIVSMQKPIVETIGSQKRIDSGKSE